MIDKVVKSEDVGSVNFPFPGYTGDIKIKPLNGDYALGPSMIHIRMAPGAFIPAHLHKKATEVLCILDGDFINENKAYGSGDFLHSKPGTVHGPHTTKKGCSFLALYTANSGEADPADFFLAEAAKRSRNSRDWLGEHALPRGAREPIQPCSGRPLNWVSSYTHERQEHMKIIYISSKGR